MIAEVKGHVEHPFVLKHIQLPTLDHFQLHFMYIFLQSRGLNLDLSRDICLPFLYIQLALDLHEQVPEQDEVTPSPQAIKWQQLSVLAGDLSSSYYYHYLSERNKVEEIRFWTKVIQSINELKMQRHLLKLNTQKDSDELKELTRRIKSFLSFSVLNRFSAEQVWYEVLELYTFLFTTETVEGESSPQEDKLKELFASGGSYHLYLHDLERWLNNIKAEFLVLD